MFKRLHLNTEFEGTGIGLALCKKIVEKHNGFISARSKLNEGSTFIISLPFEHEGTNSSPRVKS
jgi:signal transduction histidine kinase